jgi:HPt (histidine-containing phosphotransfer) domain-containing protein
MIRQAMADADDETRALLASIWAKRRGDVLDRVALIQAAIATDHPTATERTEAARQAHMLAGSAGTFGFPTASERARSIELALESGAPIDAGLRATAAALHDELAGDPPA